VATTVVDPSNGTETADRAVVFDGDRIVAVVASDALPTTPSTRTIDERGKFVIPGLWDMHVHFSDPPSAPLFIANGVTGVRVMWGNPQFGPKPDRFHYECRDAFDRKEQVGPCMVIASTIMDGPHPIWPNSLALSTPGEGRKAVDDAKADGADFIKVYSGLPKSVFLAIADDTHERAVRDGHDRLREPRVAAAGAPAVPLGMEGRCVHGRRLGLARARRRDARADGARDVR
jgi:hypothetical protein